MRKQIHAILRAALALCLLFQWNHFQIARAEDVIDIATAIEFDNIRNNLTADYRLVADIDLTAFPNWVPIGNITTPFTGSLNGGNYTIRNLTLANTQASNQGLFGVIEAGATITNLQLENATITAGDVAGLLAGINKGTIQWTAAQGIITGGTVVGGLVGENDGAISDSFAIATVSGRDKNGGLVGTNNIGGTLTNTYAASKVIGAVTNNYVSFSGDDYISIPHNPAYVTDSFTLEAWFQWTPPGDDRTQVEFITGKGLENFEIHTGGISGTNDIRFIPVRRLVTSYGDARAYQDVPNVLQPGWNHVAAVWDFANQKAMVLVNGIPQTIYQNGIPAGTEASIPLLDPNTNPLGGNTNAFFIGARNDNGGQPYYQFHGNIADVRFWKSVRTPAQISSDKYKQLTGNEEDLIGYWKLDETNGAVVNDSSSLQNNGTIIGTPTRVQVTSNNGGLVGLNSGTITSSYYDSTVSGLGDLNGTGLPTAQMRQQASYAGWDFGVNAWKINEDYTYPTPFTYTIPFSITSVIPSPAVFDQSYTVNFAFEPHYIGEPSGLVTVDDGDGSTCNHAFEAGDSGLGSCNLSSNAGSKVLTASYAGDTIFISSNRNANITVEKADQAALALVAPASLTTGSTANLSTTGGSGTGTVTYSVGSSTGCSVSGSTLSVVDASGSCSVTATKAADSNYNAVTSEALTVTLTRTDQSPLVVSATPSTIPYGSTATLSTTGGSGTGTVTYSVGSSTGCSVSDSTLSVVDASGSCSVTATKAADSNYNAVTSEALTVTLTRTDQSPLVVSATPSTIPYGSTATLSTTGGSGTGTVTYSVGSSTGCSVSGSTLSVVDASGSCSVTATKAADSNYNAVTSEALTITLTRTDQNPLVVSATPSTIPYGSTATLSTTGGSGTGTVTYSVGSSTGCSVSGSTLSVVDASGSCSVTATKAADSNYNAVTSEALTVTLTRTDQSPLVVSATPSTIPYGSTATLSTTGGSGTGTVTFSVGSSTGCSVSGSTLSVVDASGSCSVTATKAADSNYNAVTSEAITVALTPPSTNARLISLVLGGTSILPEFDPEIFTYTATVPYTTTSMTITPIVEDFDGATFVLRNASNELITSPVSLQVGENTLLVVVTAEDGTTTLTYTIVVTRSHFKLYFPIIVR